jgi:hypothetical protein
LVVRQVEPDSSGAAAPISAAASPSRAAGLAQSQVRGAASAAAARCILLEAVLCAAVGGGALCRRCPRSERCGIGLPRRDKGRLEGRLERLIGLPVGVPR